MFCCFLLFVLLFLTVCFVPLRLDLDELNDGHLGVVSLPVDGPQHTCVSTFAVCVTVRGGLKQSMNELLVVHPGDGLTTGVQVSPLSELDHVVNVLANGLGTDLCGLDASVPDDFRRESAQQSLSLIGGLAKLLESLTVAHHLKRRATRGGNGGIRAHCVDCRSGEGRCHSCCM